MKCKSPMACLHPCSSKLAYNVISSPDLILQVSMAPFSTMFSMFSDWGGFLSILVAVG